MSSLLQPGTVLAHAREVEAVVACLRCEALVDDSNCLDFGDGYICIGCLMRCDACGETTNMLVRVSDCDPVTGTHDVMSVCESCERKHLKCSRCGC